MRIPQRTIILIALGLLVLFVLSTWGMYTYFTSKVPGANDFYPRWKGTELYWHAGVDPYSDEATAAIQRGIYGRLAEPDEDQVLFVYPFYTVFLLWPLIGLEYAWVQAIWLTLLMFILATAVLLTLRLIDWQMPPWLLALILLWSIIFYNSARTVILGQFAAIVFLGVTGCLLALKHERDGWAGILLTLTTFKPQMSYLLIPALFIWAIGQRRWRFLSAFVVTMALLTGLSFLLLPTWLFSFIAQVRFYPHTPLPVRRCGCLLVITGPN